MSKSQRDKGRRGACEAMKLLSDRDWSTVETRDGQDVDDAVAIDPQGQAWSVEVKNQKQINIPAFLAQARKQAEKRKLPWMLLARIDGGHGWLVLRKGERGQVWHGKEGA